jgi:hypothetical protein
MRARYQRAESNWHNEMPGDWPVEVTMTMDELRGLASLPQASDSAPQAVVGLLPSRFQLADIVRARGATGMVSGICFRKGKVFYEVGGVMHPSDDVMDQLREVK